MSFVTKNRIKNWLLIFLLVTNIATISTILYNRWNFRSHMLDRNPHMKMKEFIKNELGLTAEQKLKINKESEATDSTREILMGKIENLRISIYSQFASPNPDSTVIDSLARSMSSLYSEAYSLGVSHNLFMLNICTDEQKAKLKKKYGEIVNKMKAEQKEEPCKKDDD